MTQTSPKTSQRQPRAKTQGLPVRSNLRAGIVLQVDVPGVTLTPVAAEAPTTAAATPAATA